MKLLISGWGSGGFYLSLEMLWQKQAPNFPKTGQLKHSGARCHLEEFGGIVPRGHLGAENENLKAKEVTRAKKKNYEMKQLSPLRYILITGTVTLIKSLLIHCHKSPSGVQAPKMCPGRGDGCEELQHPLVPACPGHRGALAAPLGGQMLPSCGAKPPPAAPGGVGLIPARVLVPCSTP